MASSLITIRRILTSISVLLFLFLAPVQSFTDTKVPVRTEQVVHQHASRSRQHLLPVDACKKSQQPQAFSFPFFLRNQNAYWKQWLTTTVKSHHAPTPAMGFHSKIPSSADELISQAAV